MEQLILPVLACTAGFLLDAVFGDPEWICHPVRIIGQWISYLERGLRKRAGNRLTEAGALLWLGTAVPAFAVPAGILFLAGKLHPALRFAAETFWCYQIFAARSLCRESGKVYDRLKEQDLQGARRAVSMIVGRETAGLSAEGVAKAAVETVAENTSDGVTAPMLYMLIGGAPLGFLYKAVNTMDSMVGYKNETYIRFGKIPAKMDDLFNYLPARITAVFMILSAFLTGLDGKNALRIYCRDRRRHASPNAAQTESVCAGALGVQLAGDAVYFGRTYHKELIGDRRREVEPEDIKRACRLMYVTSVLMLVFWGGLRILAVRFL